MDKQHHNQSTMSYIPSSDSCLSYVSRISNLYSEERRKKKRTGGKKITAKPANEQGKVSLNEVWFLLIYTYMYLYLNGKRVSVLEQLYHVNSPGKGFYFHKPCNTILGECLATIVGERQQTHCSIVARNLGTLCRL